MVYVLLTDNAFSRKNNNQKFYESSRIQDSPLLVGYVLGISED
jgi:hypothetical protein